MLMGGDDAQGEARSTLASLRGNAQAGGRSGFGYVEDASVDPTDLRDAESVRGCAGVMSAGAPAPTAAWLPLVGRLGVDPDDGGGALSHS